MKFSDHLNVAMHPFFASHVRGIYRRQLKAFERKHPESFGSVSDVLRKKHICLWSKLMPMPYDGWLRLLTRLSGIDDERFVPADVYYTVIERCLNNCNLATSGIDDKNQMYNLCPWEYLPKAYLRFVRGVWFDGNMNPLSCEQAKRIAADIDFDVVGKVAADASGGHSVKCLHRGEIDVERIASDCSTYIVQEKVDQEPIARSVNPTSVNTCRIVTFRRPWSGETSVVAAMFRAGCSNTIVDNISSGGCCVDVAFDGQLADSGVDYNFGRVAVHPRTGIHFAEMKLPFFAEMCNVATDVARKILDYNILGFDVIARPDGTPCIIEVNTASIASVMVQMAHPLFGDDTERLVDWCLDNKRYDTFSHLRTFY